MDTKRNYLIFGATGGIGSALIEKLTSTGSNVLGAGRDPEKLAELSRTTGAETVQLEALSGSDFDRCFKRGEELYRQLDGVVNCVGSLLLKPAHLTKEEEWQKTIHLNLNTAFHTVRCAGRAMLKHGGSVVLISSAAARVGMINHEAIAAAKAGILGLMRSAAATYAKNGIRFNAVAPGLVRTKMSSKLTSNEMMEQASLNMHPLGRLGKADDVAGMISWLLQPEQSWITGQTFGVDGGLATVRPRTKV